MKTKTLKTATNLLILLLIAGSINSCKKEKESPLEGRYKVEVKVTKRLPLLAGIPNDNDYPQESYEDLYGYVLLDTGANVCCRQYYSHICPMEYTLEGVKIIKEKGLYYIKSREWFTVPMGERVYFDLPLTINNNEISYDLHRNPPLEGPFLFDNNNFSSSEKWPWQFIWFSLNLKKKGNETLTGTWIFHDISEECAMQFPISKNVYKYNMVEFAEVTFTKIKD
ncbi:MAG: hypothetical protein J5I91_01855 [Bacteroidetes bacterium]|nr:hypothetical protein [Bacteroidota bacterium]